MSSVLAPPSPTLGVMILTTNPSPTMAVVSQFGQPVFPSPPLALRPQPPPSLGPPCISRGACSPAQPIPELDPGTS